MRTFAIAAVCLLAPNLAAAHFPYLHLERKDDQKALHAYFGHGVEPTDAKYFTYLEGAKVWRVDADDTSEPLSLAPQTGSLATGPVKNGRAAYVFLKDQGVRERNGVYLLTNYAKTFSENDAWSIDTSKQLKLDVNPKREGETLILTVRWNGQPLTNTDVAVEFGDEHQTGKTETDGRFRAKISGSGTYTARAWRVLQTPGERDGKKYDTDRHYSTVTLDLD